MHKESFVNELRRKAQEARSPSQVGPQDDVVDAWENDVSQFVQLVNQAAEEGLWEIDLTFAKCTVPQLNKLGSEIKAILFDVFVVVNSGEKKIKASWRPENQF